MPALTPAEWLPILDARLAERQAAVRLYEDYYAGRHRLAFASAKFREAFGELFAAFATNWCGLVVDALVERLAVQGIRFGEADDADEDAWSMWQANGLDAESIKAHTEAVKTGTAYLLVAPPRDDGVPRITVEHPSQVIVAHDPGDRRRRLAALKKYRDQSGATVAVVYTPERVSVFRRGREVETLVGFGVALPEVYQEWAFDEETSGANPLGEVPVVPIENRPGMLSGGQSDLAPAVALNDAANKFFSDMIVASEFQAFRQRVLTGVEVPKDENGKPIGPPIEMAVSRLLMFEEPDAKAFDLSPGDLGNYVQAIDLAVQHLAAQTRTPPHYLLAKLVNLSADALKAAEAGLVAKARRAHVDFGEPWEEAHRLAFGWRAIWRRERGDDAGAAADHERATATDAEMVWRDPENRAPGVVADSLVKKRQIGVPEEMLWEEAGYSPQQVRRMRAMRQRSLHDLDRLTLTAADQGVPAEMALIGDAGI